MPDFSPDYTPRYIAEYVSAGLTHHVTVRGYRGESSTLTITRGFEGLTDIVVALQNVLPEDFHWVSAEYIPQDTNVGTPTSLPGDPAGGAPVASMSNQDKATSIGFVGRSNSTPMRLFIFGCDFMPDDPLALTAPEVDFRIHASERTEIADAISAINAAGFAANNNLPGAWKQYVNLKVNDHYLRLLRKLGSL
jgi:hypothetical protein